MNRNSANFGTTAGTNIHPAQQKKMTKIANTPGNQVYEWKWDNVDRVKTADEVQYLFEETNQAFAEELKKNPTWDEHPLRQNVQNRSPQLKDFSETHPYFFEKATTKPPTKPDESDPNYTEKMIKYNYENDLLEKGRKSICFMLQMRKQVESGRISQLHASQIIQGFQIQQFKTSETYEQYQERMKQEQEQQNQ